MTSATKVETARLRKRRDTTGTTRPAWPVWPSIYLSRLSWWGGYGTTFATMVEAAPLLQPISRWYYPQGNSATGLAGATKFCHFETFMAEAEMTRLPRPRRRRRESGNCATRHGIAPPIWPPYQIWWWIRFICEVFITEMVAFLCENILNFLLCSRTSYKLNLSKAIHFIVREKPILILYVSICLKVYEKKVLFGSSFIFGRFGQSGMIVSISW